MKYPFTLFFFLLGIGIFILAVYVHENVHKNIYEDYGIKSNFKWLDKGFTPTTNPEGDTSACKESCNLAHEYNDAIGYNLQPILMMLFVGILLIIFKMEDNDVRI